MLVVKVELWPGGNGKNRLEISRLNIVNSSPRDALGQPPEKSRYDYSIGQAGHPLVSGYAVHRRSEGVWKLITSCLLDAELSGHLKDQRVQSGKPPMSEPST